MSNLFLLTNSEVIDLFEIKLNDFEGYLYFHGSKNFEKDLVFQGRTYLYIPCEMSNLQYGSDGKQNRPVIKISNVNNFISNLIKDRGNLLGKEFNRKKMLAKDLDAINFGGAFKNPLGVSGFKDFISNDKFIVNKKNSENKERVEFELSNILDIDGLTCPSRKVFNNSCQWQYRGHGCNYGKIANYSGPNVKITESAKSSLEGVLKHYDEAGDSIRSYLGVWLDYSGVTVSENTTKYFRQVPTDYTYWNLIYPEIYFKTALNNSWVNKAGILNTSPAEGVQGQLNENMAWSGDEGPIVFPNSGRLGDNYGILPKGSGDTFNQQYPSYIDLKLNYDYNNKDLTIFYIFEPVSTFMPQRGELKAALTTEDLKTRIGLTDGITKRTVFTGARLDSFRIKDTNNQSLGPYFFRPVSTRKGGARFRPYNDVIDFPRLYSCSIPAVDTGEDLIKFYKNGTFLSSVEPNYGGSDSSHGIENLGFYTKSDIVIYEIIIFQKQLTANQIGSINTYLGAKYGISTPSSDISQDLYKASSSFFAQSDGNLGVPMADENDKTFLKLFDDKFKYNSSYGFKDLVYKGDYNSKTVYKRGDFVKIDINIDFDFTKDSSTQNSELPHRFFICVSEQGSKGINPLDNSIIWKEDKCSKSLSGCSLRFGSDDAISKAIPFGGFPGTVDYDYELPS